MSPWLRAARPKTLTAGALPVIVGSAYAAFEGHFKWPALLAALIGALGIQVGTNYVNDAADCLKGADTQDRLGPPRMAALGLLTPKALFVGAAVVFAFAFLAGLYLVHIAGWPLLAIGVVSIICGIAYTAGPFPLAYLGLGDLFVFIFFGLVAVCGTYYVHTLLLSGGVIAIAALLGLQGMSLIAVNNTRDIVTDTKAKKNTLAVRLGDKGSRIYVALTILIPFIALPLIVFNFKLPLTLMLAWLAFPFAVANARDVFIVQDANFNRLLGRVALLQLIFGLLLSAGFLLEKA
jgi:1,4-dihydroxy-2-naphthoate octaprenyltransferase